MLTAVIVAFVCGFVTAVFVVGIVLIVRGGHDVHDQERRRAERMNGGRW